MRSLMTAACVLVVGGVCAAPCRAQGFGLGGRMSMVRGNIEASTSAERFFGGQIRLPLSPRSSLEVSIDRRAETSEALTERVVELPIQGSLMIYPVRTTLSPYLLGGVGWYTTKVEQRAADVVTASATSRRFGYHAGIGAELKIGRHVGAHGDYRYTFLNFGGDDDEESLLGRLKPSYEGSMWTAGLTLYF